MENKSSIVYYHTLLIEILICFSVFAIFFGIFTNYFFNHFEEELISKFIKESVNFYKVLFLTNDTKKLLNDYIKDEKLIENTEAEIKLEDVKIIEHNAKYDTRFLVIIAVMVLILLVLCLLPLVLGFVKVSDLNFTYLSTKFALHVIIIVALEMFFVLKVLPLISPIKIHEIIKDNENYNNLLTKLK